MENALTGDWLTPKLAKMLNERVVRVIRNGFGEVSIVIVRGKVTFLKVTETSEINKIDNKCIANNR